MIRILLLIAALLAFPAVANAAYNGCSAWHSQTIPPRTIRVRLDFHHVVRVPFALYVARVTSSEWNTVPIELRKAGAVAVKVYAWFKAMHPRPSKAGCFDLNDDTRDQIYRPWKTPPAHVWLAVNQTWHWRMVRDGRLFQSGYRTGRKGPCGFDIDRYHLFARSAKRCANAGWSWAKILRTYY